ncbi:MAG: DUF3310 domain-containing protein [Alphaproteobacteria bacterium]|nr:DUF3310 domain-containing protein [Alphaproteobacteria bacterium]
MPIGYAPRALDSQEGGSHYQDLVIQPLDFIEKNKIGFSEGNVIKYVVRWRKKNGLQDLMKAKHYLDYLIEQEQEKLRTGGIQRENNIGLTTTDRQKDTQQ